MELNITGRNGSLTTYEIITNEPTVAMDIVNAVTTYRCDEIDSGVKGSCSKSDLRRIKDAIFMRSLKARSEAPRQPVARASRYIERKSTATVENLSHGKSWVCSGWDVDKHSLSPDWEGALICYVYSEGK